MTFKANTQDLMVFQTFRGNHKGRNLWFLWKAYFLEHFPNRGINDLLAFWESVQLGSRVWWVTGRCSSIPFIAVSYTLPQDRKALLVILGKKLIATKCLS